MVCVPQTILDTSRTAGLPDHRTAGFLEVDCEDTVNGDNCEDTVHGDSCEDTIHGDNPGKEKTSTTRTSS